jgi:hypothetical protein
LSEQASVRGRATRHDDPIDRFAVNGEAIMYRLKSASRLVIPMTMASSLFLAAGCSDCGAPPGPRPPGRPPGPTVTDDAVRSCDLLLSFSGDEIPAVDFDAAVRGQSIPQAPRLAISFAARTDASLAAVTPFSLRFKGTPSTATLVSESCFDAAGRPIEGTPVPLP